MPVHPIAREEAKKHPFENRRPIGTLAELSHAVARDPGLVDEIKKDPVAAITSLAGAPLDVPSDVWIYRLVVGALGLAVLSAVIGAIYLTAMGPEGRKVPELLVAIGSAAVGALAGLLAPSPTKKSS